MSSDHKTFEEKVNQLPDDHRADVVNLVEYLFEKEVKDPEFLTDLAAACRRAFDRYQQSYYDSWQDLQQDVLIRFWRWLPKYRGEAKRKTVLDKIATNVIIDAARRQNAKRRFLQEVKLDEPGQNAATRKPRKKLRQTWAGALRDYREQYTSLELQKKALEWRGD